MVEIGVLDLGNQVAVGVKVLVDDHNVILDFLGSFFHLVLDGEHMVIVRFVDCFVNDVHMPFVVAAPNLVFLAVIGGLGHGLEAFLVQHVVEIGVPNFGDQVAVNVKVLVDDHNVILDFLGFFFHLILNGVPVLVVDLAHRIVGGVINPTFVDSANHVFHAVIGGFRHRLEAFLVQHVVEIGIPNFGDQVAVNVKVLVDNHSVVLDFRGFRFLLVLEGDDIIVMGVHILVGGVVLPRASGVAPSLKGHIAVVVVPHGHKVFHVVNVVFRYNGIPGSALGIVVLELNNDILRVFFLDVGNRLQRSAVQLGDLAVGNPDGNGLQRLIAVHLVLDQSILKAGGEPLNAYRAIFVGNTGEIGSVNSKAGAGQSVAVLIHLLEVQVAEVALHRRNGEVHGVRILRDDRIILHLREEVVGKGSSAVGGIRLPSLKALRRRVQGDGIGQSVGVSSSVACFGNFRRAALQVPAKDAVCIGETVVICRRIRSRTGVLDELSHGVGDIPRLRTQPDQLCDVVELNGQVVCIGSGKALSGKAVHPVGNVHFHPVRVPVAVLPHAVYHLPVILALFGAVVFVTTPPMLSFRLNEAPIFKIGFSGLERHGVKVDVCRGNGRSQSLNRLPVNYPRNVSAALHAFDFGKAAAGVLLHMEGGAAVGHQDDVDVLHVFQKAVLAFFAVDQIVGQLQTAFHIGTAGPIPITIAPLNK